MRCTDVLPADCSPQVHGWLNGVGLGLLLPLAGLIARTLRDRPKVGRKLDGNSAINRPDVPHSRCTLSLESWGILFPAKCRRTFARVQAWFNLHWVLAVTGIVFGVIGIGVCLRQSFACAHHRTLIRIVSCRSHVLHINFNHHVPGTTRTLALCRHWVLHATILGVRGDGACSAGHRGAYMWLVTGCGWCLAAQTGALCAKLSTMAKPSRRV